MMKALEGEATVSKENWLGDAAHYSLARESSSEGIRNHMEGMHVSISTREPGKEHAFPTVLVCCSLYANYLVFLLVRST